MQETQVQSLGQQDLLEKGMATHPSILAWRIPWTEEPGGLQSMGCKESDTTERLTVSVSLMSLTLYMVFWAFPSSLDRKASACNVGDLGSISQLGRFLKDGSGNPL